jgi:Raf kinase inhibitor-like YbhB/YbcL family protein
MKFTISSKAFENGSKIPTECTCDGDDISPDLWWEGEPKETVSFALIMEDPDAPDGTFTHWIVYNLPADCHQLEKIIPIQKNLSNSAIQGKNDFGKIGYRGPCPPKGEEHRYYFRIFAMKKKLPPESIKNGSEFHQAMNGLVLDRAEYMGKYYRKT